MLQLKIKSSNSFTKPIYGSSYAAGIDIFSNNEKDIVISPKSRKLIPTGLHVSWNDPTYYMRLAPRSGLSVNHNQLLLLLYLNYVLHLVKIKNLL